jgi:hypothetical protein
VRLTRVFGSPSIHPIPTIRPGVIPRSSFSRSIWELHSPRTIWCACLEIPGGLRELVKHEQTGLLIRERDELPQALSRLSQDMELRRQLARAAHRHIERSFSLSVAADRWEQLFEDLLRDSRIGPLRFPSRPVLPAPYPPIVREDRRAPTTRSRLRNRLRALQVKGQHWLHRCLSLQNPEKGQSEHELTGSLK